MKNKKNIAIVAIVAVFVAAGVVALCFAFGGKKDNREQLSGELAEMGKTFYEKYYYNELSKASDERNNILAQYSDIGIKVDLDNLEVYNDGEFKDKIATFKNSKTGEDCDKRATRVIIYPKSVYGQTDYRLETELSCGFEEEK